MNEIADLSKSEIAKKYESLRSRNRSMSKTLAEQPAKQAIVHSVLVGVGAGAGAALDHYVPSGLAGYDTSKVVSAGAMVAGWLLFDSPEVVVTGAGMAAPHIRDMVRDRLAGN